jgi:acyl-coenzyme A thioesterase PaaI-like protein
MGKTGAAEPPCTVTAEFAVKLKRPTPMQPLRVLAHVVAAESDVAAGRVVVEAEIISGGKVTATCKGTFIAVKEGHPAFHRW